jgi:transposase
MGKHRKFSAELKAKIAVEALKGQRTVQEIASQLRCPSESSDKLEKAATGFFAGSIFSGALAIGPV